MSELNADYGASLAETTNQRKEGKMTKTEILDKAAHALDSAEKESDRDKMHAWVAIADKWIALSTVTD